MLDEGVLVVVLDIERAGSERSQDDRMAAYVYNSGGLHASHFRAKTLQHERRLVRK